MHIRRLLRLTISHQTVPRRRSPDESVSPQFEFPNVSAPHLLNLESGIWGLLIVVLEYNRGHTKEYNKDYLNLKAARAIHSDFENASPSLLVHSILTLCTDRQSIWHDPRVQLGPSSNCTYRLCRTSLQSRISRWNRQRGFVQRICAHTVSSPTFPYSALLPATS